MKRQVRDLKRSMRTIATAHGATVQIEHTRSGHFRSRFRLRGRAFDVISAATPSDWRQAKNHAAFIRRTLAASK
jgi:hypothetical protein